MCLTMENAHIQVNWSIDMAVCSMLDYSESFIHDNTNIRPSLSTGYNLLYEDNRPKTNHQKITIRQTL